MALKLITPPAEKVVSLAEAKAHLRVDHDDDNVLIERLIEAATSYLDGYTGILGQALVTQTWELILDAFPEEALEIPLGPLQSVTSVIYDDENGDQQTFDAINYVVDTALSPGWVVLNTDSSWPTVLDAINVVRVRFVAGYGSASQVPQALRHAILMLLGHLYEDRETVIVGTNATELPFSVNILIAPYRRIYV